MDVVKTLLVVIAGILAAGILLRVLVPFALPWLLYFPQPLPEDRTRPAAWGIERAEEIFFEAADGIRLHGWWFPAEGERRGAAVYFHGNAGNLASRGDVARTLARLGLDVLLFDYRGYGASAGEPSEVGLYADAAGAWKLVLERGASPGEVVLFGNSLGSAVAVMLAAREAEAGRTGPAGLVLFGPMPDTRMVGRALYPFLPGWILSWNRHRYSAIQWIGIVEAPMLFARGERDEVVPREVSRRLYEAASEPKEWVDVPAAGHADVFARPELWQAVERFVARVLD